MSIERNTWIQIFSALRSASAASRGETYEAPDISELAWPNTTGADVVAIAAIVDPFLRAQPLRFGGHGLARRWRAVVDEMDHALVLPAREYVRNREFWGVLACMCVYLHFHEIAPPSADVVDSLIDAVGTDSALRNVGPKGDGPFKHFDGVKTFDDLYIAQFRHLRELRGVDADPKGVQPIPRSTNEDVVQLADYWSKQLGAVKVVMGHAGVVQRWKAALADVEQFARKGDPYAVYPKNAAFWPLLKSTAIHVAAADEAPSKFDLAVDSVKDSLKNLPENIKGGAVKAADALASAAGDIAGGIGKIASEAGKGLFSSFGTPLLVGAGLVGLFLITRNRAETKES
ncbi:MAG: hypothetical protein ACKV2T_04415 [Kofleriaceae bacterium]